MEDYQKRVEIESVELCNKLEKLNSFLAKDEIFPSPSLRTDEFYLLNEQLIAMTSYLSILRKRIRIFLLRGKG